VRIANDVLAVLSRCEASGCKLALPGQLERRDYLAVNKVIEAAGGKWDRRAKAHLFADPAEPIIETILLTGEVVSRKQELQFFETPPEVVERLLSVAFLDGGMDVLEPSAGRGAIAAEAWLAGANVDCVEIDERNCRALRAPEPEGGFARSVWHMDFLLYPAPGTVCPGGYDRVLMNPPFTRQQDIAHVMHALEFLKPGGLLVSVMSLGTTFRHDRVTQDFQALVKERGGQFEPLPDDAFKVSGTGVKTVIVAIPGEVSA
jgi:predicted RNA methylase